MSKRVRLTKRKQAVDGSIPYPGNVNQPDRKFKEHDQYDNWDEVVNHPLPDMRHDWQDDERDEIGFGIAEPWGTSPTVASVRVAANKAVRLAYFLLGNKVAEGIIEDQADDLMLLGPAAIDRSLARYSKTMELYAADETEEEADDAVEGGDEEADNKAEEGKEATDEKSEARAAAESAVKKAQEELDALVAEDDSDDSDSDDSDDSKEAAEEEESDDEGDAKEAAANSLDIELSPVIADEDVNIEGDARLAGLFDDDIPTELPEPGAGRESSEKKGVKSLGGVQPKVASTSGDSQDISSIWKDSPDVSDIFN